MSLKNIWAKVQDKVGPLPLFSIAIILTFTILFLLFNQISKNKNNNIKNIEEESVFERNRSKLIYLNEVMSSSIAMGYLSGDFKWVERYEKSANQFVVLADNIINRISQQKGGSLGQAAATAKNKLLNYQKLALTEIKNRELNKAEKIISGSDYKKQKSIFLDLIAELEISRRTDTRLIKLHGEILLLDEVLTMSAEKSSLRTNQDWENEYNLAAKTLDDKLAESLAITDDLKIQKVLQEIREANNRLIYIEEKAFLQNKRGNSKKSMELLKGDEYFKNKAIYSDGLNMFSRVLNGHIKEKSVSAKINIRSKLFLIILSGIMLLGSWIIVWASIVSWRKKLSDQNLELEKKMSELEEFSYRTSHDLKAPLVNMRGLSRIMQADLRDGDYEEVSENLQKIGTLSTRLESLIGDIEETARIDAENDKAEEVDITQKINGEISLQSTSEGTTFKIILPILKAMPS
jgi:hypothetical protein